MIKNLLFLLSSYIFSATKGKHKKLSKAEYSFSSSQMFKIRKNYESNTLISFIFLPFQSNIENLKEI